MSTIPFQARPMSRADIRQIAGTVRDALGFTGIARVPMEVVLEFALPKAVPSFLFAIDETSRMGTSHGLADPDENIIILREDVYDGLVRGRGRDRLTAAHELGHLILHEKKNLTLRRGDGAPPRYCDPEWQADCFAGEFLVDARLAGGCSSADDIRQRFGVSSAAAAVQFQALLRGGCL